MLGKGHSRVNLSIVIPAFNEERLLPATLATVARARGVLTARGWDSEVIVCNNNSTDQTGAVAESAGARVVFEPVNQIGRARNTGAAAAMGDWIVFIDADSEPSPGLFEDMADAIASGRVLAGGSTLRTEPLSPWYAAFAALWCTWSRLARHMAGSFIFVETRAFRKIGGFSNTLFAAEELELSSKLKHLARLEGKRVVILHRHPLLTSSRKAHLYSFRETIVFLIKAAFRPKKILSDRDACALWYDGRR
jgi:glycosyltransferase involved in cell wall biosynthesis